MTRLGRWSVCYARVLKKDTTPSGPPVVWKYVLVVGRSGRIALEIWRESAGEDGTLMLRNEVRVRVGGLRKHRARAIIGKFRVKENR